MDKFTDIEFNAIARYENGRIKCLPEVFLQLTEEQVHNLHEDDWSYYHELLEEIMYELAMMEA
jgi:hypothetical protein